MLMAAPVRYFGTRRMYRPGRNVIATIAQGIDITDQKQALDRIRWLASFPELNPNPVIEMNARGDITFANTVTSTTLHDWGCLMTPHCLYPVTRMES